MNINDYSKEIQIHQKGRRWIDLIIESGGSCWLCGFYNEPTIIHPVLIEKHHIAGRKNGFETIYLCPNCHTRITSYQHSKYKEWNDIPESAQKRMGLMLKGWTKIDYLRVKIQNDFSDMLLRGVS